MPEVQNYGHSGENAQRFVEFLMLQARQAAYFLGRYPDPEAGQAKVQPGPARQVLGQLEMIREKTRGNLSAQETELLDQILNDLRVDCAALDKVTDLSSRS